VVTFHRLDENRTEIMLQVDYEPEGVVENVGDAVGIVSARIKGDLERFFDPHPGRDAVDAPVAGCLRTASRATTLLGLPGLDVPHARHRFRDVGTR
jgi:hypothetical protein